MPIDHDALVDAVRRLLAVDERRVAVVQGTSEDDIEAGIAATVPIMMEYKLVILELRDLVGEL